MCAKEVIWGLPLPAVQANSYLLLSHNVHVPASPSHFSCHTPSLPPDIRCHRSSMYDPLTQCRSHNSEPLHDLQPHCGWTRVIMCRWSLRSTVSISTIYHTITLDRVITDVGIVEAGRALGASGLISCYGLGLFHHQLIEHTHSSGFNSHQCGAMINWYNMKVKAQVRIDRVGTMCFWCGLLLWCGFDWCATPLAGIIFCEKRPNEGQYSATQGEQRNIRLNSGEK